MSEKNLDEKSKQAETNLAGTEVTFNSLTFEKKELRAGPADPHLSTESF